MKVSITVLTEYYGIFNVTKKSCIFYFAVSVNPDDFNQITIPPGAYDIKSLNDEIKRNTTKEVHFTKENDLNIINSNLSTLCSFAKIKPNFIGSQTSFDYMIA